MRRLAHDLGVEPVTIYRQLPNKDAILAGVAEKLWREMAPPEGAAPGGAGDDGSPPSIAGAEGWREQVRGMWLALDGLMQRHPNAIPIIARGGSYSPSAADGTAGMIRLFKDAGLTPGEAAELLHILSACVVGFGFATLWGREMAAAREVADGAGRQAEVPAAEPAPPAADSAAGGEPVPDDDLDDYLEATARWDPTQFTTALDIVLGAYGDGPLEPSMGTARSHRRGRPGPAAGNSRE